MAMFNSYVKLPEGSDKLDFSIRFFWGGDFGGYCVCYIVNVSEAIGSAIPKMVLKMDGTETIHLYRCFVFIVLLTLIWI